MKKIITKMTALCLCILLAASGSTMTAFAADPDGNETEGQKEPKTAAAADDAGISKEETVYVLAGADGSAQKIIVSDWIRNFPGAAAVNDRSELTEIENVKGGETYTMNDDNMLVWDAQGSDIYYQGSTEKELPVDLSVTYKLDGKPISADDLAGKSGRVTIRFDYQNKQYETVDIDGEKEKIYVPFTMLTGVLLEDDVFANVEVTNGRLIDDGSRTAVIGIAFPGLQQDLAISKDELEIPDYVEITADTSSFQLAMTATLATNGLFHEFDVDDFDSLSELDASMEELTGAMDQLLDGSSQLYDGLAALLEKSGELTEGIGQLAAGTESLKTGSGSLDSGAADLQSGAARLSEGLNTLTSNNDALNAGAKQVFDTLLLTADTQLAAAGLDVPALTAENYAQVLGGIIASVDENNVYQQVQDQVTAAVEAQRDTIEQQVQDSVAEKTGGQMQSDAVKQTIMEQTKLQIQKIVSEQMASDEVQAQLAAVAEGAKPILALKTSLDSYNAFYLGLQIYTAGVANAAEGAGTLKAGADDLKAGTSQLFAGASELYDGSLTLKNGTPDLVDGITQLRDGAMQLSEGLQEFNEEGIQKLVDAVDGDLNGLVTRLRAVRDVSLRYKSFAGADEDMDGQVKFIYRTDAIE